MASTNKSETSRRARDLFQSAAAREGIVLVDPERVRGYHQLRLAGGDSGAHRSSPLRIVGGEGCPLTVYETDANIGNLSVAYIWNVYDSPRIFLMTYRDALNIFGEHITRMPAWQTYKYWTSSNLNPDGQRQMAIFEDRWEWLRNRLRHGA